MTEADHSEAGVADRKYDAICRQIEREDGLYQLRINSCIVVNLALGAAASSQVIAGSITVKVYTILVGCCVIGSLITMGIFFSIRNGRRQQAYLRSELQELDTAWPGRFIRPYYFDRDWTPSLRLTRLTGIPLLFQLTWIIAFALISLIFFLEL